jgi:CTP synthase
VLTAHGLRVSGTSPDESLVEISELANHPFMLGTQFHPELQSRPNRPHPLFRDFITAAVNLARGIDTAALRALPVATA